MNARFHITHFIEGGLNANLRFPIVNASALEIFFGKSLFFVSLRKELVCAESHGNTRNCTNSQPP